MRPPKSEEVFVGVTAEQDTFYTCWTQAMGYFCRSNVDVDIDVDVVSS